jgi:hypothetical protein
LEEAVQEAVELIEEGEGEAEEVIKGMEAAEEVINDPFPPPPVDSACSSTSVKSWSQESIHNEGSRG